MQKIATITALLLIFNLFSNAQEIGSFTDIRDDKTYETVKIGTQTWMAENLAYKTKSDCWKANSDGSNLGNYSYLYSWEYARKACPSGWHLPSDVEWTTLTEGLGGQWKAGKKLKNIAGWTLFFRKNYGDNQSGFSALPGGYYVNNSRNKDFSYVNEYAYFWTSTPSTDKEFSKARSITNLDGSISTASYTTPSGLSVRCLKD